MPGSVSYVGSKGTKLYGGIPLNVANIFAKGPTGETLLEAFNTTRVGGNSVLFDQLLNGLTLPGAGGAVNGTALRGSTALRNSTATVYSLRTATSVRSSIISTATTLWFPAAAGELSATADCFRRTGL